MVDNIKNLGYVATCILDIFYTSVFPALESLRQDGCQTLANSKDGTLAEIGICSSNSTYLSDLQAESEEFKSLIVASLSTKIDPVKNFIKSAIDTGADILATTAVIVDPIEPWMIQMAFGIGGLVAFFASVSSSQAICIRFCQSFSAEHILLFADISSHNVPSVCGINYAEVSFWRASIT